MLLKHHKSTTCLWIVYICRTLLCVLCIMSHRKIIRKHFVICSRCHDTMTVESFQILLFFSFYFSEENKVRRTHSTQRSNTNTYSDLYKHVWIATAYDMTCEIFQNVKMQADIFCIQSSEQSGFWNIHAILWFDPSSYCTIVIHYTFSLHLFSFFYFIFTTILPQVLQFFNTESYSFLHFCVRFILFFFSSCCNTLFWVRFQGSQCM